MHARYEGLAPACMHDMEVWPLRASCTVVDWLAHAEPEEEWILVLDSDEYLRQPFSPEIWNVSRGRRSGPPMAFGCGLPWH